MKFVRREAKHLARKVFHKMVLYQQKLVSKQNILKRFVDIGMELFAMSAVCSYAASLAKKGEQMENSIELADLYCRQARGRIKKHFKDVCKNQDKLSNSIAKEMLKGQYEWLENDIIKGNV